MGPWLQLKFSCRREKWNFLRTSIHTRLITWTVTVITFSYTRLLAVSRRARAKRSREGVPAFCTIPAFSASHVTPHHAEYGRKRSREGVPAFCTMPIIHSVQYIFAMFCALRMKGPLEYVAQTGGSIHLRMGRLT